MKPPNTRSVAFLLIALLSSAQAQQATINIQADHVLHPISPYLTGACLEDVNHEVYGGLYSQMIFGESFQEPAPAPVFINFTAYGGQWSSFGPDVKETGGNGPKLVATMPPFSDGEASVEVMFSGGGGGNAGLIMRVSQSGNGADQFNGYEISLEPSGDVVLGRHQQNWLELRRMPCDVPVNEWVKLTVRLAGNSIEVLVNGSSVIKYADNEYLLKAGSVGLRTWQHEARFRNLAVRTGKEMRNCAFTLKNAGRWKDGVSGMWQAWRRGTVTGQFSLESSNAFVGRQSQRITYASGTGEFGVVNQGLKQWGMNFVAGKKYDGCLDVRADAPTTITMALESAQGSMVYAQTNLLVTSNNWERLEFSLTPVAGDPNGRFAITLAQPGSVVIGYAFLQPGSWGQFAGLPVRKDVVDALTKQGIRVLRYGGSMVNAAGYRWKNMIGPRDERPPYAGTWYPYSSDGWGIPDFLNFCEAAGFLGIPDFNINETPSDLADFIDYANGSTNTVWGAQRLADGHAQPYNLKYLELGNEEKVDGRYYQKFQALARSIWAADSNITLVVGDFSYHQVVTDPFHFGGADSGISTLSAQQEILQLARQYNREVWFDVHVWTDGPGLDPSLAGMFSYDKALGKVAHGAKYKVVVFELNANNHSQRRALGNALAINAAERDGRLPVITSANCLQPDGQNDNGWDQGLLFLNPSQVWLQPPGLITQMKADTYLPQEIGCEVASPDNCLDVSTKKSADGRTLVLQVVNSKSLAIPAFIRFAGFTLTNPVIGIRQLTGPLSAENTAESPWKTGILQTEQPLTVANGALRYAFAPYSFTVLTFAGEPAPDRRQPGSPFERR